MVDMTQEREERARETIEALNTEIQNLTKVIEEKTLGAEDTNLNELRKLRDELTNQRDNLKGEVSALKVFKIYFDNTCIQKASMENFVPIDYS